MFGILSVMVLVTLIVVIAVFIYYLIYIQNINKNTKRAVSNKKMVDIPKIIMIAIIVLYYYILLFISSHKTKRCKRYNCKSKYFCSYRFD